jgi:alpha-1,6-mannosyltransferase
MRRGQGSNGAIAAADANVSIVQLPSLPVPFSNGYRFPLRAERAADELQLLAPDIIEAGDPYTLAWSALRAGDRLGIPTVGFYHSDLPRMVHLRLGSPGRRLAAAYIGNLYSRFDLVLAPSRAMLHDLRELGIDSAQHQPLGVDVSAFRPAANPLDLRARLGLAPGTRMLAYVGRFAREKNLPWLFEAVRRLGPTYHLVAIGGGKDYLAPPANVTLLPYLSSCSRLTRVLSGCDVFVHAGDKETFGLAVLEAMACGLPVVGMAAGGVAELVPANCGVLVEPQGGKSIAAGIEALFETDIKIMGSKAREHVVDHYSWDNVFCGLLAHYRALVTRQDSAADRPLQLAHDLR